LGGWGGFGGFGAFFIREKVAAFAQAEELDLLALSHGGSSVEGINLGEGVVDEGSGHPEGGIYR